MNNEVWSDIKGYEGYYKVSSFGRIISLTREETYFHTKANKFVKRTRVGREMRFKVDRYGYYSVHLRKDGESEHTTVHRVVALSFIPRKCESMQVNHLSGDKTDNSISNLEWCTASENTKHAYYNNLMVVSRDEKGMFRRDDSLVEMKKRRCP